MISDSFWTDPELVNLTTEDRVCLLLLLTNGDSNIVGIYRTVWRVVGAGIGWTEAQTLLTARDLMTKGHIEIDDSTGWVWVKEWWKHNSIRGAFVGNVKGKALKQLSQIPEKWKPKVYEWLLRFDEDGTVVEALRQLNDASDNAEAKSYKALIILPPAKDIAPSSRNSPYQGPCEGLPSPSQGAAGNHTPNHTLTFISTTTHTRKRPLGGGAFEEDQVEEMVNAALWATEKVGQVKNVPGYRRKVRGRLLEEGPNSTDFETLDAWRNAVEQAAARDERLQRALAQEDANSAEIAAKHRLALSRFEALTPDKRQHIVDEFRRCIVERNPSLKRFYARQGLMNKAVHAAFMQYFSDTNSGDSV